MMTSRFLVLAILAVSQCHSFKTADEVVPESMLLAGQFSSMSPQAFIEATTASGGTEADCKDFADTTIATTTLDVTTSNALLADVDTGAGCATEGDSLVTAAQATLTSAQSAEATALTNYNDAVSTQSTACSAAVSFSVNLDTLEANNCYNYASEANYATVKAACTAATSATASTLATHSAAQATTATCTTGLAAAEAESAALTSACNCRVQDEQAAAWTAASAAVAARETEWNKAHEVLCALDTATTGCNYASCPALTQPTMAAGVADETCVAAPEEFPPTTVVGCECGCSSVEMAQSTVGSSFHSHPTAPIESQFAAAVAGVHVQYNDDAQSCTNDNNPEKTTHTSNNCHSIQIGTELSHSCHENGVSGTCREVAFSGRCNSATGNCHAAETCAAGYYQSETVEVTSAPGHLHYGAYSVAGDDWYEYAVTLYNAADDSIIQTTLYRGDSLSAYQFSYLTLPNVGSYYARFFLASYDRTGGAVLGATIYLAPLSFSQQGSCQQ